MKNQTLQLIASRRSHRSYTSEQLSTPQLESLMDAALQSPSAMNRQPWHFSFVQNKELLSRINKAAHRHAALLDESVRSHRFSSPDFNVFYHAPTVVFISAPRGAYEVDCGIAVQTLALAAESLGLGSVIVGLARLAFEDDEATEFEQSLCFPEGDRFVISIVIGRPDDVKQAPDMDRTKISLIK